MDGAVEDRSGDIRALEQALLAAEQDAALVPSLRQQLADVQQQLVRAGVDLAEAGNRIKEYELRLVAAQQLYNDLTSSVSWRITRPLRALKQRLG